MVLTTRLACAVALALALAAGPARADEPSPEQKIAMTAKPSVVKVWGAYIATFQIGTQQAQEAIGGTGTGWFMTPDGYIATNAHVVDTIQQGDEAAKKALYDTLLKDLDKKYGAELAKLSRDQIQQILASIKLVELKPLSFVELPNGDKLNYEIKQFGKPGTGRDCAIIKVKVDNAPTLPIGDSSKSQVEDKIVVIGYPGVADMQDLLSAKTLLEPSVTDGAISALKQAASGEQILQISAPITHGNSGGPAIDQHGNVVGLATFGNEGDIQGFNFLVASKTLLEMVKDAKIDPKPSDTNKAWRAGLDHYWNDEYTAAVSNFEEVEMLFPAHADAPKLIVASHQAQKDGKEKKPASNNGLIIGGAVGAGALLLVVVIVLIARSGKKAKAKPMPQPQPGFAPPPGPMPPGMQPQQPQMYGRAPVPGPGQQPMPVARTVAIQQGGANASGGVAPTAFGSLAIGSLTCTRGQLFGQRFALTATGIIIGRQPGVAHVLVNDHRASGKHVWIGIENGRLVAIDQGTTNGTYINDVMRGRITRAELRDGDVVIVGEPDCLSLQIRLGG
ncbi:MAG TPA: trypsin-like peptidase domain-containing protein [Kofleriaceae bacterium]|nr:trypsin-like peptidase domain-containing protein [Kofleriaceae bacterium]